MAHDRRNRLDDIDRLVVIMEIRTFSPEEQARWDVWLADQIKKMVLDPNSVLCNALIIASDATYEKIISEVEVSVSDFVRQEIGKLRADLVIAGSIASKEPLGTKWLKGLLRT